MNTPIFSADLWLTADTYNHTLRATVPGSWVLRLWERLPGQSALSPVPEFYGNTANEAKRNAVEFLKGRGLSGILKVCRCNADELEAADAAQWAKEQAQTLWAERGGYAAGLPRPL